MASPLSVLQSIKCLVEILNLVTMKVDDPETAPEKHTLVGRLCYAIIIPQALFRYDLRLFELQSVSRPTKLGDS